jgi:hypothetical protein
MFLNKMVAPPAEGAIQALLFVAFEAGFGDLPFVHLRLNFRRKTGTADCDALFAAMDGVGTTDRCAFNLQIDAVTFEATFPRF